MKVNRLTKISKSLDHKCVKHWQASRLQAIDKLVRNSTTRTGLDRTNSADLSETRADQADFPTKSGRARLVEFGH